VPTSNEVPTLLEQVSTAARRAGLDLSGVEPVPVIEGEQFDTYKYKVTVTGAYHPLAAFLTNVGSLTRIIAPVNLGLGTSNNQPSYASGTARAFDAEARLECKFEIQTYVVRTAPKPAPAKEAKKS
jgi:type IV pilus assembly protein PilO